MHSPLAVLHALTILSEDPEYIMVLSEDTHTERTKRVWPLNVLMHSPLTVLHALTVLSADAEYKVVLSEVTHKAYT